MMRSASETLNPLLYKSLLPYAAISDPPMTEFHPFSEEFADATATLYFRAMRGQSRQPSAALAEYFCEILLRNPWATPGVPSLVCVEKGKVIAALGVVPRPMEFRGQKIIAATL